MMATFGVALGGRPMLFVVLSAIGWAMIAACVSVFMPSRVVLENADLLVVCAMCAAPAILLGDEPHDGVASEVREPAGTWHTHVGCLIAFFDSGPARRAFVFATRERSGSSARAAIRARRARGWRAHRHALPDRSSGSPAHSCPSRFYADRRARRRAHVRGARTFARKVDTASGSLRILMISSRSGRSRERAVSATRSRPSRALARLGHDVVVTLALRKHQRFQLMHCRVMTEFACASAGDRDERECGVCGSARRERDRERWNAPLARKTISCSAAAMG